MGEVESGVHQRNLRCEAPIGASLLAKNARAPRTVRKHSLSLTFFASKLAPTGCASATSEPGTVQDNW
ncbi:hypothetical protein CEC48_25530 [Pseudomonas sp. K2I15]|nr:hypothetical protein CEC48_25530 [Pseudomonas sp. K2I15]